MTDDDGRSEGSKEEKKPNVFSIWKERCKYENEMVSQAPRLGRLKPAMKPRAATPPTRSKGRSKTSTKIFPDQTSILKFLKPENPILMTPSVDAVIVRQELISTNTPVVGSKMNNLLGNKTTGEENLTDGKTLQLLGKESNQ